MKGIKSEVNEANIIKDYLSGMLVADLIKKHKIGYKRASRILKQFTPGYKKLRKSYDEADVLRDYKNGLPVNQIKEKYRVSAITIYTLANKNGIRRYKAAPKIWKKEIRSTEEPTCPIILRLREKYRNFEQNTKEIGQSDLTGKLSVFVTVQPKELWGLKRLWLKEIAKPVQRLINALFISSIKNKKGA